jgi:hypothetical protein
MKFLDLEHIVMNLIDFGDYMLISSNRCFVILFITSATFLSPDFGNILS